MAFEEQFVAMFSTAMAGMILLGFILGLAVSRAGAKVAVMSGRVEILWHELREQRNFITSDDEIDPDMIMESSG